MLDSTVAMLKFLFTFFIILAQETSVNISSPQTGETVRGQVEIIGDMDVPNFLSAELDFSYAFPNGNGSNPAETWFSIQTFPQPVVGPAIAVWDTTSVTDGDYTLRLRVNLQDGSFQDVFVSGLKIRNVSPLPAEIISTQTPVPSFIGTLPPLTLTSLPATVAKTYPSQTPLPANPASVTMASIYSTFGRGALIVLVAFIFFSLILRLRKN
ncbi:MAG: hypothetical protein Q8K73_03210 [Anaerolineales bacterium]|nr:hypothetical protein [Anaerolineales bacterium]